MAYPAARDEQLAIHGGNPLRGESLPSWPHLDDEQIEAATRVMRSGRINYWTGEEGRAFEDEFAEAVGVEHAVAVANGTVALDLALHAFEIGPGDEVVVPCRTFIASASCVCLSGATPRFADVDPISQNVTAETIAAQLSPRTKAIIVVHLAGWPCDMDPILELAARHGLKVIEDCAQAHGARYKGQHVGSMGDAGAFSFCQDKIITTGGEGGMVTVNSKELWQKIWSYKDHGKNWDAVYTRKHPTIFKWVHESPGTNWRLTEMQSAIGRVALRRLPLWVGARRRNASILDKEFAGSPMLRVTLPSDDFHHSYYKHYAFLRPELLQNGVSRDDVVRAIQAEGVPCGPGSCPEIYLEQAFAVHGSQPAERLPVARQLGETSLMFLVHPTLTTRDVRDTASAVQKVLRALAIAEPLRRSA